MMTKPRTPSISTVSPIDEPSPSIDLALFRADLREAEIEEMVGTLLDTFHQDLPSRLVALEQAVESGDVTTIESAAHAFKSGASTIRATRLADLLKECEHGARTGSPSSSIGLLELVRSECAAVRLELEAYAAR
jgi:HPt (histidine-containing phosphotransfer) domain-containing protein